MRFEHLSDPNNVTTNPHYAFSFLDAFIDDKIVKSNHTRYVEVNPVLTRFPPSLWGGRRRDNIEDYIVSDLVESDNSKLVSIPTDTIPLDAISNSPNNQDNSHLIGDKVKEYSNLFDSKFGIPVWGDSPLKNSLVLIAFI